jgi:hypothetical protein
MSNNFILSAAPLHAREGGFINASRFENSLNSIKANISETSRIQRATAEKLEGILQKKIENELA